MSRHPNSKPFDIGRKGYAPRKATASWWVGVPRDQFSAVRESQAERIAHSKFGMMAGSAIYAPEAYPRRSKAFLAHRLAKAPGVMQE